VDRYGQRIHAHSRPPPASARPQLHLRFHAPTGGASARDARRSAKTANSMLSQAQTTREDDIGRLRFKPFQQRIHDYDKKR